MDRHTDAQPSLLTLRFAVLILSAFLYFFTFHSYLLLPLRIKELGGGASQIGLIMGAAAMSTLLATPAAGMLVDRWGKKPFLVLGTVLMAASTLPFTWLDTLSWWFPALRFVHGVSFSLCFISAGTLSAALAPAARRSQALGLFGVFTIVNYALAPYVGKRVVEHYGFDAFFSTVFVVALFAAFVSTFVEDTPRTPALRGARSFMKTFSARSVLVPVGTLLLTGSAFIPALSFLAVYSVEYGIDRYDVFFLAYTLSALSVRFLGGWIPDKVGKKRAASPALFVFAASVVALGLVRSSVQFIPVGIAYGVSHGFLYPAIYALVMDLVREDERGKAFSACSMAFTGGGMGGSFAYGVVADLWGYRSMYVAAGLVAMVGFVLFALMARESPLAPGRGRDACNGG